MLIFVCAYESVTETKMGPVKKDYFKFSFRRRKNDVAVQDQHAELLQGYYCCCFVFFFASAFVFMHGLLCEKRFSVDYLAQLL